MTQDELISRQALQLAEQADRLADFEKRMSDIHSHIYCIGGPLNDNKLGYSKEQMVTFFRIAKLTE